MPLLQKMALMLLELRRGHQRGSAGNQYCRMIMYCNRGICAQAFQGVFQLSEGILFVTALQFQKKPLDFITHCGRATIVARSSVLEKAMVQSHKVGGVFTIIDDGHLQHGVLCR